MSFRKRNVGLNSSGSAVPAKINPVLKDTHGELPASTSNANTLTPGLCPSSLDGRLVTSTGTPTLDNLLAGHGGLALGSSILLEEGGTTDFAGALLRYYAAEGVVQGHQVHVIGGDEHWGRQLPGLVGVADGDREEERKTELPNERMKIAWRYEGLGGFGAVNTRNRGGGPVALGLGHMYIKFSSILSCILKCRMPPCIVYQLTLVAQQQLPNRRLPSSVTPGPSGATSTPPAFCHLFDLTKHLVLPSSSTLKYYPLPTSQSRTSPFEGIMQELTKYLASHPASTIHRLVVPIVLSPATYPAHASSPRHLLTFLHSLRGLLRKYPMQLTTMMTIPLELHPRNASIVRWAELLSDGVLELSPFPHSIDSASSQTTAGAASAQDEQPQGILKIHRLPVFHEKGGGGGSSSGLGDDLAFTVSRRRFTIKPYSLPPVEGDTDAQQGNVEGGEGKQTKLDIEF